MSILSVFVSFASISSAFAMSFDKLDLASLAGTRNLLFALGFLILAIAGYMYLSCSCCASSSSSKSGKKKSSSSSSAKKHSTRAVSADSKRNSSSSSVRRSPRKSKASN